MGCLKRNDKLSDELYKALVGCRSKSVVCMFTLSNEEHNYKSVACFRAQMFTSTRIETQRVAGQCATC